MLGTDYNDRLHAVFHEARALLPETVQTWIDVLSCYMSASRHPTIIDLGSGTGRFSTLLADAFQARVLGVEPAAKMRTVAENVSHHPHVEYLQGAADDIPLEDERCDYAWVSAVLHHIPELDVAAKELHRVLRPRGVVFIRSHFRGRLQHVPRYRFFPGALAADNARFPEVDTVRAVFQNAGFRFVALNVVKQVVDRSLSDYMNRIQKRGSSTLDLLPNEEFDQGLTRLRRAVQQETRPRPVTESIDLLILRRRC